MQKLLNNPVRFVDEMLEGLVLAHPTRIATGTGRRTIVRVDAGRALGSPRVRVITGGGSGHLPLFVGYVGDGLVDGCAVGDVFASPSPDQVLAVTRDVSQGAGVVYLYGNYGGDVLNFDLAAELATAEGIEIRTVRGHDDVASAPTTSEARRRGIAGMFFLFKVAGAKAREGGTMDEVVAAIEAASQGLRSMGVGLSACTVPAAGRATFEILPGEMEVGMGIHGEPGVRRGALEPADQVADELLGSLLDDLPCRPGDRVAVLVNGLGATPQEELYIVYRRIHQVLAERGITVARSWVGEFATSLEMAGVSVSLLRLDEELERLVLAPCDAILFRQG